MPKISQLPITNSHFSTSQIKCPNLNQIIPAGRITLLVFHSTDSPFFHILLSHKNLPRTLLSFKAPPPLAKQANIKQSNILYPQSSFFPGSTHKFPLNQMIFSFSHLTIPKE